MNIGLLNERIMIQKLLFMTDEIGNHVNTWEDYHPCACTVSGEGGQEKEAAAQTVDHTDIAFTVRSCGSTDAVTTDGYRIVFAGCVYDIISIDHMNYRHKCVKYRCRKAGSDEGSID